MHVLEPPKPAGCETSFAGIEGGVVGVLRTVVIGNTYNVSRAFDEEGEKSFECW